MGANQQEAHSTETVEMRNPDEAVTVWQFMPALNYWCVERSYPRFNAERVVAELNARNAAAGDSRTYHILPRGENPNDSRLFKVAS